MAPLVSVLLPVYNAEAFIGPAVESILGQTFGDFELIVVNDGSTDGSPAILERLAAADARVRLISRPNTGYVPALNEALAVARGDLIARMDADDVSLPARFERQVAYLADHPACVMVGTHVAIMDGDGAVIGPMAHVQFGHDAIDRALMNRGWALVHPTIMARAWAVRQVGGYRPELCPNEDHDLFLRLAEVGPVENLPEVLLHYRKHAASESTVKQGRSAELVTRIIVDACRRRGVPVPPAVTATTVVAAPPPVELERAWAWQAVGSGNVATARKYARRTLGRRPLSPDSWRLAFCAARGR